MPVGEIARDLKSDEHVTFSVNGAGGSPHMAIMGGVGSGKTRTAVHMLRTLRRHCELPLLAFDFKGDLTDSFTRSFGATSITPSGNGDSLWTCCTFRPVTTHRSRPPPPVFGTRSPR